MPGGPSERLHPEVEVLQTTAALQLQRLRLHLLIYRLHRQHRSLLKMYQQAVLNPQRDLFEGGTT